jgi:NADH dehydrogenase FAD-containing subunit
LEAEADRVMKAKIVIAGGGFGGLYAAKYFDKTLARRDDVEVTLISRENFILFTPMLFFGRDITQIITVRDVQELSDRLARVRDRTKQSASNPAESALDTSA